MAQKLGVSSRFVQKYWDMLPQDFERGDIDMVFNGYEWTPQCERAMASTMPYYVFGLFSEQRDRKFLRSIRSIAA